MHNYTHHKWCGRLAAFIASSGAVIYTEAALVKRLEAISFITPKKISHA